MSRTSPALVGLLFAQRSAPAAATTVARPARSRSRRRRPTAATRRPARPVSRSPIRFASLSPMAGLLESGVTVTWATPQRRIAHPGDQHHRRERSRDHELDPRRRWRCADRDRVASPAPPAPRVTFTATSPVVPTITVGPGGAAAVLSRHHHHQRRPVGALRVGHWRHEPQREPRHRERRSALPASPGLPGAAQDAPYEYFNVDLPDGRHVQVLLHGAWQQSVERQRHRHVRHRDGQLGHARLPSMKYLLPLLAVLGAAPLAAQGACVARAGFARGADDGHQVGGHRLHARRAGPAACHGRARGTRARRADGARGE